MILMASLCLSSQPAEASSEEADDVDVSELVFGHIGDSYGWHIPEWSGRQVVVPLPCIVHSSTGWHVFMSSKIAHGHEYEGLFIAEEGRYADKIVERGADGELVRPFDISITKNVASLIFTAVLLLVIVLWTARWYNCLLYTSPSPRD